MGVQVFGFLFQGKSLSHFLCTTRVWWKSRSHKEEDESSASDSGDSLPPLEFIKDGTKQKVEEIGPGAWLKEMGWTTISQQQKHDLMWFSMPHHQWFPINTPPFVPCSCHEWFWTFLDRISLAVLMVVSAVCEVIWWNSWICRWLAWTNSKGMCWGSHLVKATRKRGSRCFLEDRGWCKT